MFFILTYITQSFVNGIIPLYMPILLRDIGYRTALIGVFLAIAEGAGILGPFLFGRFADRSGNYKVSLITAYSITAAVTLPIAHITNPVITALLIVFISVGFRSVTPLIDAMTTINLGEKGNYGRIRMFGSLSYVCFVFLMQWVPVMRPNTAGNISFWMCLTCVLAITGTIIIPSKYANRRLNMENSKSGREPITSETETKQKKSIWTPVFIIGLISIILSRLASTPAYSFFPLFLVEYMQWDAVGLMFGIGALSEIPVMYFSHRLIRRFGAMPLIAFSSAMVALRLGIYAIFPFKAGIVFAQLLNSICFGVFHPAAIVFISSCVPPEKRSFGMTLYISVGWGIPNLIGNLLCGFVVEYAGYRQLFGSFTIFAILGAAVYYVYRFKEAHAHGRTEKT